MAVNSMHTFYSMSEEDVYMHPDLLLQNMKARQHELLQVAHRQALVRQAKTAPPHRQSRVLPALRGMLSAWRHKAVPRQAASHGAPPTVERLHHMTGASR
jgi:hypothetical protein